MTGKHTHLELEYTQTNENIRTLAEIRFKLLGLLPTLGGIAIFALSFLGLSPTFASAVWTPEHLGLVVGVSFLGFLVTLGIVFYDQRNSELYNGLIHRAKYLESLFDSFNSPHTLKKAAYGGQFTERPKAIRRFLWLFPIRHDVGLALIYGPVLGGWCFPFTVALLNIWGAGITAALGTPEIPPIAVASLATIGVGMLLVAWLDELDKLDKEAWDKVGEHGVLVLVEEETGSEYRAWVPYTGIECFGNKRNDAVNALRKVVYERRESENTWKEYI